MVEGESVRNLRQEDGRLVEFDVSAGLRGRPLEEIEALREGIASALMTPNEGRSRLNRAKSTEPGMDEFYLPFNNLQPVGHPAVAEVAVIGIPDAKWGETIKALVVVRPGADVTAAELSSFRLHRLSHFKCPTPDASRPSVAKPSTRNPQE